MNGELKPGDKIASEHVLMLEYKCSRMTVNKALSKLSHAGLIERRRRAGSFVARPKVRSMVLDVPDLSVEVAERGQSYSYRLLRRLVRRSVMTDEEERKLVRSGHLMQVDGVHYADEVPLAAEFRIVNFLEIPELADVDLAGEPIAHWLLKHVPWTEVESRIMAVPAADEEAKLLQLPIGTPCLQVERWTWRNSTPITYVKTIFVGSSYALTAQFGVSQKH